MWVGSPCGCVWVRVGRTLLHEPLQDRGPRLARLGHVLRRAQGKARRGIPSRLGQASQFPGNCFEFLFSMHVQNGAARRTSRFTNSSASVAKASRPDRQSRPSLTRRSCASAEDPKKTTKKTELAQRVESIETDGRTQQAAN